MPETNKSLNPGNVRGKLFLIPAPLGENTGISDVIPESVQSTIKSLGLFIVEELKTARRFLKRVDKNINIDALNFMVYNEHSLKENPHQYIEPLLKGSNAGLLSEAGLPCISDPGSEIVAEAHRQKIEVIPLSGPSSLLLALIASGFNGQNFAFHGYLPVDKNLRAKKIRQLEMLTQQHKQTQIFIETPYRNHQVLEALLSICNDETMLCIAVDLTLPTQKIISQPIRDWKKTLSELHKRPAVFLLFSR